VSDALETGAGLTEHAVRSAHMQDLESLAVLFDQYRQFYHQAPDLQLARAYLQARMERADSVLLVAPAQGPVHAFAQLYPTFCSVSAAPLLVLYDLFVAPAARRTGLARALLRQVHAHARSSGAARVELATARTNAAAQRLYESLGWTRDEVFLHYSLDSA
jgi:ribosomal protein S18 acetylase RimI-like enzyme